MHLVLACCVDPMIQDSEVEAALFRLDLLPSYRHEDGVDMHASKPGDNDVRLLRCARRRIAQLTSQNQKWLAIYDELPCSLLHSDVSRFGRGRPKHENSKDHDLEKYDASENSHSSPHGGYLKKRLLRRARLRDALASHDGIP
jgi:hypothetical protein